MANITLHDMFKTPYVLGVFSRLKAPGLALSDFYGFGPDKPATEVSPRRSLVYDIFNTTRTMSNARGPYVGPSKIAPQKVSSAVAHALRMYEALPLHYEKIYQMRPMGGQIGEVDAEGASYVGRQQKYVAQRMMNALEFMVSRMFRGGFSLSVSGEDMFLREKGSGTIDVEYNVPASHLSQLAVGDPDGATDVITTSWDNTDALIVNQLLALNKASERETGYVQKHIWINSTTYGHLLNNAQLQSIRGTANRVFDRQTSQTIKTTEDSRESGYEVTFPAIPQFTFHIYDAVSHVTVGRDSDTYSELSLYIPNNKALITPEPEVGGWYGMATCTEPIRENDVSEVQYVNGLHSWAFPVNDPPGFEQRILWNGVPLLYNPKAFYFPTVIF